MTAAEIVLKIKDKSIKNKETNVSIGYDITILILTDDINGAVKYVEDYFQCGEKIAIEAIKMWQEELGEPLLSPEQKALNNERERLSRKYKPKCPTCQSTNVQEIGIGARAISVIMLGLHSNKINKSFKCKNCGYTW